MYIHSFLLLRMANVFELWFFSDAAGTLSGQLLALELKRASRVNRTPHSGRLSALPLLVTIWQRGVIVSYRTFNFIQKAIFTMVMSLCLTAELAG